MTTRGMGAVTLPRSVCLLLAVFACGGYGGIAAAQEKAVAEYSGDADTVILSMDQVPGGIAEPDPTPRLRVYGDGRVVVHYPEYMTKAGDYTLELTRRELSALVSSMVDKSVADFDAAAVKQQRQQAALAIRRANPGVVQYRSSDTTTVIELNLVKYQAAGSSAVLENVSTRIEWYGLQTDVKKYPGVESLANLAEAEKELLALCERVES